jgi:hypothetical protein
MRLRVRLGVHAKGGYVREIVDVEVSEMESRYWVVIEVRAGCLLRGSG